MTATPTKPAPTVTSGPGVTRSKTTTLLGGAILVGMVLWFFLAFVATGPDVREVGGELVGQQDAFRLIYVHVPAALVAYLAFSVTAIGSVMVLVKK